MAKIPTASLQGRETSVSPLGAVVRRIAAVPFGWRNLKTHRWRDLRATPPGDLKACPRSYLEAGTGCALNASPVILDMKGRKRCGQRRFIGIRQPRSAVGSCDRILVQVEGHYRTGKNRKGQQHESKCKTAHVKSPDMPHRARLTRYSVRLRYRK
jgi:hypothetical protein